MSRFHNKLPKNQLKVGKKGMTKLKTDVELLVVN